MSRKNDLIKLHTVIPQVCCTIAVQSQTITFETKTKPQTQFIGFWVKLLYVPMMRKTIPPPLAAYK